MFALSTDIMLENAPKQCGQIERVMHMHGVA